VGAATRDVPRIPIDQIDLGTVKLDLDFKLGDRPGFGVFLRSSRHRWMSEAVFAVVVIAFDRSASASPMWTEA
jgi:hypothetical protein